MTPFMLSRKWLRSAPPAERAVSAVAALLFLSLVLWAATPGETVPGSSAEALSVTEPTAGDAAAAAPDGEQQAQPGSAPGDAAGTPGAGAAAARTGPGDAASGQQAVAEDGTGAPAAGRSVAVPAGPRPSSAPGGAAQAAAVPGAAPGCGPQTATDQGVTASSITVGVVIVDLSSASGIVAVATAADQEEAYRAVFDKLNKEGGVRCRKVVLRFYRTNPLESNSEHAACLQMQQDKVFVVLNNLYTPTEQTCVAKAAIPNIWYTPPHTDDVRKYGPYILSFQPDFDRLVRQYVRGAKALGFFKGMKKLGILEGSCFPDEKRALVKELKAAGFDPGAASTFNYGCTGAPAPSSDQAAVLQFQREGVTHVLNIAFTYDKGFSSAADRQRYSFELAHMDDVSAGSIESSSGHPGDSFDGTLLITTTETGANNTPGYRFNAATKRCSKTLTAIGQPAAEKPLGQGIACVHATLLKAAADKAPSLTRRQLATGLARAGTLDLPYPAGPLSVTDAALPTGGTLARPAAWATSCQCWKVTDARYRTF